MTHLDELLREHDQSVPIDDAVERHALDAARQALRLAVAVAVAEQGAPPPRRRVPRLALVAGLAAAIAVVIALLPGGTGKDGSELGPQPASARVLLERAARAIAQQAWHPLRPGEFFHYREVGSWSGKGAASARAGETQDVWIGANGYARIAQTGPDTLLPGGEVLVFHATRRQLAAERKRQRHGAHLRILAYRQRYHLVDLTYQQLIRMPTDPGRLERFIERHATGGGPRFSDIFGYVEGILPGAPLPPAVSAAMYRVIARLPHMRVIGPTRDHLGRPGIAIGLIFPHQPGRIDLIIDPKTGVLLGERSTSFNAKLMHAPVGSVTSWSVIEDQAVVTSTDPP